MKILLDTCSFLWIIKDDSALSETARFLFSQSDNEIFLSVVSVWEIIIKHKLGKFSLPKSPDKFIMQQRQQHRIESLELDETAIMQLLRLPDYHKDPFDKMLICQAIGHGLSILTPDKEIQQYPIQCYW